MTPLVDTGAWVALLNRRDPHHRWAREVFGQWPPPFFTCDAVIAEVSHFLGDPALPFEMMDRGLILSQFDTAKELSRLRELHRQFADRRPDFADLCLVRMSELHSPSVVLTIDRSDFTVYRRNGRQTLPLACPP